MSPTVQRGYARRRRRCPPCSSRVWGDHGGRFADPVAGLVGGGPGHLHRPFAALGADEHLQPVHARGGGLAGVTQSDRVCDAGRGGYLLVDGRPGLAGRELRVRVAVPVELEFDRSRPLGRVVRVQGLAGCPRELRFVEAGDVRPLPQIGIAGVGEPLPVCGGR